jgi:hypothetical protein
LPGLRKLKNNEKYSIKRHQGPKKYPLITVIQHPARDAMTTTSTVMIPNMHIFFFIPFSFSFSLSFEGTLS